MKYLSKFSVRTIVTMLCIGLSLSSCNFSSSPKVNPDKALDGQKPLYSDSPLGLNASYWIADKQFLVSEQMTIDGKLQTKYPDAQDISWYGYLNVPQSGNYTFRLSPGLDFLINKQVINKDKPIYLEKGHQYSILAHVSKGSGIAEIQWSHEGKSFNTLSSNYLHPNKLTVQALPTTAQPTLDILNAPFDSLNNNDFDVRWIDGLNGFQEGINNVLANGDDLFWKNSDYSNAFATDSHSGAGALQLQGKQEYNLYTSVADVLKAGVYFPHGGGYRVSAFVKASAGAICNVKLLEPNLDVGTIKGASEYKQVAGNFIYQGVPSSLNVRLSNIGSGKCNFDDVKITWVSLPKKLENPAKNYLKNGSFEQPLPLAGWILPDQNLDPKQFLVTPGVGEVGQAAGFRNSQAKGVATQKIYSNLLKPNAKYVLKAQGQQANENCILALRESNSRKVVGTVTLPPTTDWQDTGLSYTTPTQSVDLDVELHLGSNAVNGTCLFDNIQFGPVNTSDIVDDDSDTGLDDDNAVSDPIGTVEPEASAPAVFAGGDISFKAGTTGGSAENLTYSWDFGDGASATGDPEANGDVVHTYSKPGYYQANLRVSDPVTHTVRTASVPIAVMPDIHDIPSTRVEHEGAPVTFDVAYPVPGLTYEWTFEDGTIANSPKFDRSFEKPGFHDLTLTIYDDRVGPKENREPLYKTETHINNIIEKPTSQFKITLGSEQDSFDVIGKENPEWTYTWDFGDGSTATGAHVKHGFVDKGRHGITLTVSDKYGQQDVSRGLVMSSNSRYLKDPVVLPLIETTLNLGNQAATSLKSNTVRGNIAYIDESSKYEKYFKLQNTSAPDQAARSDYFGFLVPTNIQQWSQNTYGPDADKYDYVLKPSFSSSGAISSGSGGYSGCFLDYYQGAPRTLCDSANISEQNATLKLSPGNNNQTVSLSFAKKGEQVYSDSYSYNIYAFDHIIVPRVMVNIIPDTQLDDDSVKVYSFDNNGKNEIFALVNVRESQASGDNVNFSLPFYVVDGNNQILSDANGLLNAKYENSTGMKVDVRDGVVVNGQGALNVSLPIKDSDNGNSIDISQLVEASNYSFGDDHLNGSQILSVRHDMPLMSGSSAQGRLQTQGLWTLGDIKKWTGTVNEKLLNAVNYGKNALSRKSMDNLLKNYEGSTVSMVIGFVPVVGPVTDLLTQVVHAAEGKPVDKVSVVLASIGLTMDVATMGTGDITAPIRALYKLGPVTKKVVEDVVDIIVTKSPQQAFNFLKDNAAFAIDTFAKGAMKQAVDSITFVKSGIGDSVATLQSLTQSYGRLKAVNASLSVVDLIRVAKYGVFAPEAAKAMAKCGSCVGDVDEIFKFWREEGKPFDTSIERIKNIFTQCKYSLANFQNIIKLDITKCPTKEFIKAFENEFGSENVHILRRHGEGTTIEQQQWRAKTGRTPDDPSGKIEYSSRGAKNDSSRFLSNDVMLEMMREAREELLKGNYSIVKYKYRDTGRVVDNYVVIVKGNGIIAEGYLAGGKIYATATKARFLFDENKKLVTGYGVLEK